MSFAALHKLVAYMIAGLGLIGLSLGGELSPAVQAAFALAFAGSYFAEGEFTRSDRYSNGWTAAVVLLLLVQIARGLSEGFSLPILLEFAGFLQISRLFNRRTAVDYQQIAVIAFLHLIAATALSTSLVYAAVFFGFVIATPWMLALSHLRREIEGNYPSSGQGDEAAAAAIRRVLASKRVVGAGFLVGTALLTLPLFAMTLAIFFMVPRVGKGFLSLQRDPGKKVAGFSNSVELGDFGLIRDDPTVVLRVTPLPETDEVKEQIALRLRGTSFDRYDGRVWHRTPSRPYTVRRAGAIYPLTRWPREDDDASMRIVLDHLDETVVFLPEHAVALAIPPRYINGNETGRPLSLHGGGELRYADDDELGLIYTTYSTSDARETSEPDLTPEQLAPYLEIPSGHERVIAHAMQLTRSATTDGAKVQILLDHLQQSGTYRYTLDLPDVGNAAPLDAFLFTTKRGHCEYFSTALAIMARAVGVPSRNVTGFVGGSYNTYGKYYAIKQGDAHSWVEVFIAGHGWITVDPTPSGALSGRLNDVITRLRDLADAMRTRWLTSVIAYDLRTQMNALRDLAQWSSQFRDQSNRNAQNDDTKIGGNIPWRTVGIWVLALVALGVIFTFARRRSTVVSRPLSNDEVAVVQLYRELERALDRRGYPRPPNVTPLEHAHALQALGFPDVDHVLAITTRYMQVRYGAHTLHRGEPPALKARITKIKNGPPMKKAA